MKEQRIKGMKKQIIKLTAISLVLAFSLGMTGCANTVALPNDNEQLKIVTEVDKVVENNIETGQIGVNAKITYKQDEVENVVAKETTKEDEGETEAQKQKIDNFTVKQLKGQYTVDELNAIQKDLLKNGLYTVILKDKQDTIKVMDEAETRAYYSDILSKGGVVSRFWGDETKNIYHSVYDSTIGKAKAQAKAQKEAEEKAHIASLVKMLDNEIHLQNAIGSNGSVGNSIYWDGGADWGFKAWEGSALRAVNSLNPYGASGYCMRNGLVVPTAKSERYWVSLGNSGCPARVEYSHAELEVFKINNPNYANLGWKNGNPTKNTIDSHFSRCVVNYIGEDCFCYIRADGTINWESGYRERDY